MFYHFPVKQQMAVPDSIITLPAYKTLIYNWSIVKMYRVLTATRLYDLNEHLKFFVAKELCM